MIMVSLRWFRKEIGISLLQSMCGSTTCSRGSSEHHTASKVYIIPRVLGRFATGVPLGLEVMSEVSLLLNSQKKWQRVCLFSKLEESIYWVWMIACN